MDRRGVQYTHFKLAEISLYVFYYFALKTAPERGPHDRKQIFGQEISQCIKHVVKLAFVLTYAGVSRFRSRILQNISANCVCVWGGGDEKCVCCNNL